MQYNKRCDIWNQKQLEGIDQNCSAIQIHHMEISKKKKKKYTCSHACLRVIFFVCNKEKELLQRLNEYNGEISHKAREQPEMHRNIWSAICTGEIEKKQSSWTRRNWDSDSLR